MATPTLSGRQFVIQSREPARDGSLGPVGGRSEILERLARCNTAPERPGADDVLYGPGVRLELAPGQDPVTQILVTVSEEEIGWLVLLRLVKQFGWKLLDPATGRELNLQPEP